MSKSKASSPYKGQCLCGSIQYEVDEINEEMAHCHCTMCRKFHGSAFSTFAEARVEDFHWLQGSELLTTYLASNGIKRQFCKKCGSSLIFISSKSTGKFIEFSLGTLDTEIDQEPDAHIYMKYCVKWYKVNDNLPRYLEGRDGIKKT